MKKHLVIYLIFLLNGQVIPAQQTVIDSLEELALILEDGNEKVDILIELCANYYSGEKATHYANEALRISKKIDDPERLALSYRQVGWNYYTVFELENALAYADSSLAILEGSQWFLGLEKAYNLKAIVFLTYEQREFAIDFFTKAYQAAVSGNNVKGQARMLNNLGIVFFELGRNSEAIDKHKQSLEIGKQLNHLIYIGRSYYNLGTVEQAIGNYNDAMEYFLLSIDVRNKAAYYNGVAESNCKLAEMIFEQKAMGENVQSQFNRIKEYGYANPMQLLDTIMQLPRMKENMGIKLLVNDTKIKVFELLKNYEDAYHLIKTQKALRDSLVLSDTNLEAVGDIKLKYEKELLATQNQLAEEEIKRKTFGQYLLTALSLLLLGGMLFLIQFFRQRRKLKESEHYHAIREKLSTISQLKTRISDILDHEKDAIELRPMDDLNELMTTPLTGKEYEVLQDIAGGKSNKEIAKSQFISENTVKFHLKNIYSKLDVGNRKEALKVIVSLT